MDEIKNKKLIVVERIEEEFSSVPQKPLKSKQTNPIAQKLVNFNHTKIGKFSVKDLFKK